ncbi:MAG TPA: HupE/UreJ family protein [Vicinamibacterales bacterium]|nr:HupE/UreJ family protein [Vicinamibacterales bacterium]
MLRRRLAAGAAIMFAAASSVTAHELGKTQVVVTVNVDGTYQCEIAVDPDALLMQLQLARDGQVNRPSTELERDRALAGHAAQFLAATRLTFDGTPAEAIYAYRPPPIRREAAEPPGTVTLTGRAAPGARTFTLQYDLAGGTFALVARIHERAPRTLWVEPGRPSEAVSLGDPVTPLGSGEVAREYFALGFTHILPKGADHILFVVGLFLLSTNWRPLLAQISAFTIAHSITLGLTAYGLVALPAQLVEPMIALSIAYVAVENLLTSELRSWRVTLVFVFGLLHGMGFASVLRDLGLPRHEFLTALVTFNAGVEAGQLAVVGLATLMVWHWRSNPDTYRRRIVQPSSMAIGLVAIVWTLQRLF